MKFFTYDTTLLRGATFSRAIRYSLNLCQSTSPNDITIGSKTFVVQTGLAIAIGQRIRASLVAPPVDDPTQFVEGVVTAYSGTILTVTIDTVGGTPGASYSVWQLSAAVDLTGATFDAKLYLMPDSCAGRQRTPVTLSVFVTGDPKYGIFSLYLTPAQTALLVLGEYLLRVLYTPATSTDKFLILSGTVTTND